MPTVQTASQAAVTLSVSELETLIRRVVREEVAHAFEVWGFYEEPTAVEPGSPIDEDLTELLRMKKADTLRLLTHAKVWGPDDGLSG
jgi:hypothetical protein